MALSKEARARLEAAITRRRVAKEIADAIDAAGLSEGGGGEQGPAGPQGPQGIQGSKGDQGPAGVVSATAPVQYDPMTQTVSFDTAVYTNRLIKGTKTIFCIDNGDFATGQDAINAAAAGDTILFGVKSGVGET
jgi:hypothetical protein